MIKFFRHIRKDLMEKNKTGKYLKYAIGEIVLVVIGILIALQINNWNENKKLFNKTQTYLNALNTEIETNISNLNIYIETTHSDIVESATTLANLHSEEAVRFNDSLLRLTLETRPIYKSLMVNSTFDDLINSGVLENLNNTDLKNKILTINPLIESINENYTNAKNVWNEFQVPYLMKYSNASGNWDSIRSVPIMKLPYKRTKEAFVNNHDYANILVLRMRMMGNYESTLVSVKEQLKLLSSDIETYLKD
jgi:hypothetical protein